METIARCWRVAFILCAVALGAPANAHDLGQGASPGTQAKWNPARLRYMPLDRLPVAGSAPLGLPSIKSIVVLPNKWAQTQTIRVCFVGGSDQLRAKILKVAEAWTAHTNLRVATGGANGVTCNKGDRSEIRIGFAEPGYWSYIGHDSVHPELIANNLVSMNLQGFDTNPPAEPRFTGLVLHEWGHALGLHHEHQSPAAGCDAEYDWDKLYAFYQNRYGWDRAMVDQNVRQLMADRSVFDWSERDPQSVMIYGSNPEFLKSGTKSKCYFKDNNSLSAIDVRGIEGVYPKTNPVISLKLQAATLSAVLKGGLDPALEKALTTQHGLAQKQLKLTK